MKRLFSITGVIALLCATLLGVAWFGLLPEGTPFDNFSPKSRFIRSWRGALLNCPNAAAATTALRSNKEGGEAVMMADGSWVAVVMEHACCTGAGFDATLYVTSTGEVYLDPESRYCGWLPLGGEIYAYPKRDIAEFLSAVSSSGKPLTRL